MDIKESRMELERLINIRAALLENYQYFLKNSKESGLKVYVDAVYDMAGAIDNLSDLIAALEKEFKDYWGEDYE